MNQRTFLMRWLLREMNQLMLECNEFYPGTKELDLELNSLYAEMN